MSTESGGYALSVVGPPGSGKSHLAFSATTLGKTVLFAAPMAELMSYRSGVEGLEAVPLVDEEWRPSERSFKSTAYGVLMEKVRELEKRDDVKCVVFDTMSAGPSEAVWHNVLAGYGTDDPRELGGNSRQPYVTYASRMKELLDRLDLMRFRKKCHLITLWHEDLREIEGLGTPRKETEKVGQDYKVFTKWDMGKLPLMYGSLRQDVQKWYDLAFFAEPVVGSNPFRCRLVPFPDATRLSKTRLRGFNAFLQTQKITEVPNDFPALLALIEKSQSGGK